MKERRLMIGQYMKLFFTLMALWGMQGCVSTTQNSYYVLSVASQPSTTYSKSQSIIGVEKVSVPAYLYKRNIAVAQSSSQITLRSDALWGEDLDEGLTNRLIGFLQKKFNQPNVYAYPWDVDHQPDMKLSVQVTRFIAQEDKVYLDATWSLVDTKSKKREAKLFSTTVPTNSDTNSIVSAMDRAFAQFEETIAAGIRQF